MIQLKDVVFSLQNRATRHYKVKSIQLTRWSSTSIRDYVTLQQRVPISDSAIEAHVTPCLYQREKEDILSASCDVSIHQW